MVVLHREKVFGSGSVPHSGYLWCLHCERAYKYGTYREETIKLSESDLADMRKHGCPEDTVKGLQETFQMCPYDGCDGSTVFDGWDWEDVRKHHPGYPEVPELNKVYPLYLRRRFRRAK